MEKLNYIQDGGKNYLKSEEISEVNYITGMLIHNDIPTFAPAMFKSLNSENYICYSMNGLIPISQSFEMNKLTADRAESFIRSIIRLYKSMEEFMLPFDRVIVDETYIYESYNKKNEFYWIYGNYPTECSFTSLFERLLDRVEYRDDRAVKMIYSMYQAAKDSEEILNRETGGSSILKIKEKAEEILSAPYQSLDTRARELIRIENEKANFEAKNQIKNDEDKNRVFDGLTDNCNSMARRYREAENSKMKRYAEKTTERKTEKKNKNKKLSTATDKKFDMKSKLKKVWKYLNSDIGSKPVDEDEKFAVVEEEPSYNVKEVHSRAVTKREAAENSTTLLTGAMIGNGVYCLKSEDLNENNILLTEFPFFIGKSEEKTNHRIEDSTVSRFHARVDKENDELWLTDLNSTNGTFLNGIRMIPYDRIRVSRGDSIVISRKRYEVKYLG